MTHAYLADHRLVPARAASIATLPDAFCVRLTGRSRPRAHPTLAHSMGGFDLALGRFRTDALEQIGLAPGMLPELASDGETVGQYRGIPVIAALGDNQASFLGATGGHPDAALINVGTGAQVSVAVSGAPALPSGFELRPYVGDRRLAVGATLAGGAAYALLASFFDAVVRMYGIEPPKPAYEAMADALRELRAAGRADGAPRVRPTFYGTRAGDAVGGLIEGLTATHFTPAALAWGTLRGVAEELHELYAQLPCALRPATAPLFGAGNALRVNPYLRDAVEEVFGRALTLAAHPEEAAQGAALWAQMAAGR